MKFAKLKTQYFAGILIVFSVENVVALQLYSGFQCKNIQKYKSPEQFMFQEQYNFLVQKENILFNEIYMYNIFMQRKIIESRSILQEKRPILNFSGLSFKGVVNNMIRILQTKINNRNKVETRFVPLKKLYRGNEKEYSEMEDEKIDPRSVKFFTDDNHYYKFSLSYDGSVNAKQPGNNFLRQSNNRLQIGDNYREKQKITNINVKPIEYNVEGIERLKTDKHYQFLLLANEVARRKVVDKNKKDFYKDLPIFCAIAMASDLIEKGKITFEEFWTPGSDYHIFTGDTYVIYGLQKTYCYREGNFYCSTAYFNWEKNFFNKPQPLVVNETKKLISTREKNIKNILKKYIEMYGDDFEENFKIAIDKLKNFTLE